MENPILSQYLAMRAEFLRGKDDEKSERLLKWAENADPDHAVFRKLYSH